MENKFGMFIHWGLYSISGLQEQELARYDLDNKAYEKYANIFNPEKYNPEEWVLTAKKSGMKYICFTTKHHDGFCMWDTAYTDYNIMNTPYGKDVLKMLADACKKHGMLLSLYYSNPDWHHPDGFNPTPGASHQWKAVNPGTDHFDRYKDFIRNQITELLTNYGPIYTLFWDIPPRVSDPSINELVRRLQPGILINDRGFDQGDFSTPERGAFKSHRFTRMTEACNAIGVQSWGYREDEDFHSVRYLTTSINRVMAMNGSYLLNLGPKADGTLDKRQTDILEKVGNWYNRMEGSLENADPDTFDYQPSGGTCLVNKKNGKSYFNYCDGIGSTAVSLTNYPCVPKQVRLLNTGKVLPCCERILPAYLNDDTGIGDKRLHIQGIPIDELASEPIVIEIEW